MKITEEMITFADWNKISACGELEDDFILKHKNKIKWKKLLKHQQITEAVILECEKKVNWLIFSMYQELERFSDGFIKVFKDKIDWIEVSKCQRLSMPMIEKYADLLDWNFLANNQTMDEAFVLKHIDRMHWYWISGPNITLSNEFIREHFDKLNPITLACFHKLEKDIIDRMLDLDPKKSDYNKMGIHHLMQYQKMTKEQQNKWYHIIYKQ